MNAAFSDKKTFDTFIEDTSNRFALAVCKAVAEGGQAYNPLTIYGESGCGKTHLLMAIREKIERAHSEKKVGYFTVESITADFINNARKNDDKTYLYGQRCLEYDVILIDEIEELKGKEGTQEETFYMINRLLCNEKTVVLACERPLKELPVLCDRLLTRFECGLICDISSASRELREKYTVRMSQELDLRLNEDAIRFISKKHKRLMTIRGELLTLRMMIGDEELGAARIKKIVQEGEKENE